LTAVLLCVIAYYHGVCHTVDVSSLLLDCPGFLAVNVLMKCRRCWLYHIKMFVDEGSSLGNGAEAVWNSSQTSWQVIDVLCASHLPCTAVCECDVEY